MKRKFILFIIIILIIIILPILIFVFLNSQQENEIYVSNNKQNDASMVKDIQKISQLQKIAEKNFSNDTNYAVVIKNLNTRENYSFNEDKEYNSASLYKLWILAVALQKVRDGEIDEDEIVSGDKNKMDLTLGLVTPSPTGEDVSVEREETEPVFISMKVVDAIKKMITESDNYAALLLTQKLGYRSINAFITNYKFVNSDFGSPPKTNASDIALYFELLYKGKIINENVSSEMIEILKDQTLNDRIPKYLPKSIQVAHKTGELFGAKHDAGIVFNENEDYIIIVLSQTDSESIAAEKIAKFSEDIFNYFNSGN